MEFDSVKIVGHTDPTGKAAMNDKLSRQRAESVKRYLVARGVPADKIETEGVGSSMPMVVETDCAKLPKAQKVACYQPDRRVEIEVQGATSRVAAQ
jgi:OOP family OmpA-OmpF porin